MDLDIQKQWTDALESDRYKQGVGALTYVGVQQGTGSDEELDCCLGVLCKLAVEAGIVIRVGPSEDSKAGYKDLNDHLPYELGANYTVLPQAVVDWAGLDSSDPVVGENDGRPLRLSTINDQGTDFKKIAKVIKEKL